MKSSLSDNQSHRKKLGLDLDLVGRAAKEKPTDNKYFCTLLEVRGRHK